MSVHSSGGSGMAKAPCREHTSFAAAKTSSLDVDIDARWANCAMASLTLCRTSGASSLRGRPDVRSRLKSANATSGEQSRSSIFVLSSFIIDSFLQHRLVPMPMMFGSRWGHHSEIDAQTPEQKKLESPHWAGERAKNFSSSSRGNEIPQAPKCAIVSAEIPALEKREGSHDLQS